MSIYMKGNYIFTKPGEKAYLVSSNYVNYIELGIPDKDDYYLEAKIDKNMFMITARLYNSNGNYICKIEKNSIKDKKTECKIQFKSGDENKGYRIVMPSDNVLLELYLKDENTCIIKSNIYDKKGNLIAMGNDKDFLIYKGPAVLGKSNGARGIVLGS